MMTKLTIFLLCFFLDTNVVCVDNNCLNTNLLKPKTEIPFDDNKKSPVFKKRNDKTTFNNLKFKSTQKWNINKVKSKRYEIINILWKKTKIFLDTTTFDNDSRTVKHNKIKNELGTPFLQKPTQLLKNVLRPQINVKSTTPSSIEFYYFHDDHNVDIIKEINTNHSKHKKSLMSDLSLSKYTNTPKKYSPIYPSIEENITKVKQNRSKHEKTSEKYTTQISDKRNATQSQIQDNIDKNTTVEITNSNKNTNKCYSNSKTIASDRVKFFDIYDSDTYSPYLITTINTCYLKKNKKIKDKLNFNGSLLLGANEMFKTLTRTHGVSDISRFATKHTDHIKYQVSIDDKVKNDHLTTSGDKVDPTRIKHTDAFKKQYSLSHKVKWSDYPFVAAYVYEPLHVRCDAAAISPHWLVAAGACLYRHHKDLKSDEPRRSAFVIYCSDNWRQPVRITYVRRSIIHPRFHPVEKTSRHLYNIGVIQVVNSMSNTCSGWLPVSLMSHQFTADYNGTEAIAIGWGLDRFDYKSHGLPKGALMMHKNLIYSKKCPGNNDDNNIKRTDREITKNMYCVSLLSYQERTVHGSLLLMEGKLIALYLQDERRVFGKQSAEYTCIWRQLPWILDVAREPEDLEFLLDI